MLGRFVDDVGSLALGGMSMIVIPLGQNSLGLKMFGLSSIRAKCGPWRYSGRSNERLDGMVAGGGRWCGGWCGCRRSTL